MSNQWFIHRQDKLIIAADYRLRTHHHHHHHHPHHHRHQHHQLTHYHHKRDHHIASHHQFHVHCSTHMMYIRPYRSSVFLRRKSRDVALAASPGSASRYPPQALLYTSVPCHGSPLANIAELNQQPDEARSSSKDKGEEKLASLLGRGGLIITRSMEWANVVVGYRQEHRYALLDLQDKSAIRGFIVEKSHWLVRQLLRSRRPFKATVMDEAGRRLFTMRRPIWFFNSTIFIEMDGKVIGFVKSKWHPWRRICDLYQGKKQFASMENPGFWSWTFVVKDETGGILALIDRHYRSWGHEMLTDASRYIVRFGNEVSADGLKSASQNEPDKARIDDKDHDNEVYKVS
eukprot:c24380_g1_i1 orf=1-1032(-)